MSPSGPAHPRLLLLGAAAVLTAYGAGFSRTSEAAEALAVQSSGRRRPPPPSPEDAASGVTPSRVSENNDATGASPARDVSATSPAPPAS
ncbi:MAG: hypothetical protein ACK55I_02265, partial [bacterium]